MNSSRRQMIERGLASGAACLAAFAAANGSDEPQAAPQDEPVTFTIKDVGIERCDEARRSLTLRFGKRQQPSRLVDIPAANDIQVRVSHVFPGVVNNLPFEWRRVEALLGRPVSVRFRATSEGLTVASIASANDSNARTQTAPALPLCYASGCGGSWSHPATPPPAGSATSG